MLALSINQFVVIDRSEGLREHLVDGVTFSPHGSVTSPDGKDASVDLRSEPVQRLAEISVICNDAKIVYNAVSQWCIPTLFVHCNGSVSRTKTLTVMWANPQRRL